MPTIVQLFTYAKKTKEDDVQTDCFCNEEFVQRFVTDLGKFINAKECGHQTIFTSSILFLYQVEIKQQLQVYWQYKFVLPRSVDLNAIFTVPI